MRYGTTRRNMFLTYPLHRSTLLLMLTQCFKYVFSGVLCRFIREDIYYFLLSTQQNNQKERWKIYSDHIWNAPGLAMQKKMKILNEQKKATKKIGDGSWKKIRPCVRHLEKSVQKEQKMILEVFAVDSNLFKADLSLSLEQGCLYNKNSFFFGDYLFFRKWICLSSEADRTRKGCLNDDDI